VRELKGLKWWVWLGVGVEEGSRERENEFAPHSHSGQIRLVRGI